MTYELYALTSQYDTFTKRITRKIELTEKKKEELAGKFADDICQKKKINILLYGCNLVKD